MSTEDHDYNFRTELFGAFPETIKYHPGYNAVVGKKYKIRAKISSTAACYSIDDDIYASKSFK